MKYIEVDGVKYFHGNKVRMKIKYMPEATGILSINRVNSEGVNSEDGYAYFCTNDKDYKGLRADDMFGYEYSWLFRYNEVELIEKINGNAGDVSAGQYIFVNKFLTDDTSPIILKGTINNSIRKNVMNRVVKFAKELVLSSEEKLLRKHGLKDEQGEYTSEAMEVVIGKLIEDNKAYLVEIATKFDKEK